MERALIGIVAGGVMAAGAYIITAIYIIPWLWDNIEGYNLLHAIPMFMCAPLILCCAVYIVWFIIFLPVAGVIKLVEMVQERIT